MTYTVEARVGARRCARTQGPDDHQGRGRPDGQQRISWPRCLVTRRAAADRRRQPTRTRCCTRSAMTASPPSSPPTGTATTGRRCSPRSSRPPAPALTPVGTTPRGIPAPTQVPLDDGDPPRVGHVELTARHLVGHTPGSIALVYDDPHGHPHVFTGDCLFPGGLGNTHKDPKAFASLDARRGDGRTSTPCHETRAYPGNGNDTTLVRNNGRTCRSGTCVAGEPVARGESTTPTDRAVASPTVRHRRRRGANARAR